MKCQVMMEKAESSSTRAGRSDLFQLSWYPVKRYANTKIKNHPSIDQSTPASKIDPLPNKTFNRMGGGC